MQSAHTVGGNDTDVLQNFKGVIAFFSSAARHFTRIHEGCSFTIRVGVFVAEYIKYFIVAEATGNGNVTVDLDVFVQRDVRRQESVEATVIFFGVFVNIRIPGFQRITVTDKAAVSEAVRNYCGRRVAPHMRQHVHCTEQSHVVFFFLPPYRATYAHALVFCIGFLHAG